MKNIVLFLLLFSFSKGFFAQENKKRVLVMDTQITNALQTKNKQKITVDLFNFSEEEKVSFINNSAIYSQYLKIIPPLDNASTKYDINLHHIESYKYIGRFFLNEKIDFISVNSEEISIYEFINLKN